MHIISVKCAKNNKNVIICKIKLIFFEKIFATYDLSFYLCAKIKQKENDDEFFYNYFYKPAGRGTDNCRGRYY